MDRVAAKGKTQRVVFVPYAKGKRGKLVAGQPVACRNEAEASRRAEKAMANGRAIGAHVVLVIADEEAGDYGEPIFLGTYGEVPEAA